jgi:fused signal recognition particle receptor
MLGFKRKNKNKETPPLKTSQENQKSFFSRLKKGLGKTRHTFTDGLSALILGKKTIDPALYESLETLLLSADVGLSASEFLINEVTQTLKRKALTNPEALIDTLKESMLKLLTPLESPLELKANPTVILMVGINGAGKTTTIGKLAKQLQTQGKSVMLAAGDTFRAAAIDQLKAWGQRNNIPVISQEPGADSASVSFDAIQSATAKNIDVLIADTAGRLHTQDHLMEELIKIQRVMKKCNEGAPDEVLLVLDASTGQNALTQAHAFHKALNITGICLTKLDGTAKGGILFAIAKDLGIPIKYIGIGESIDDLHSFSAAEYIEALFE